MVPSAVGHPWVLAGALLRCVPCLHPALHVQGLLPGGGSQPCLLPVAPAGWPSWGALSPCPVSPEPPKHDSTVAVIVGASVGGFLGMVILVLMVVKCVRRKKQQRLNTDDQKTEEEGKTDGEGNPDEGTK